MATWSTLVIMKLSTYAKNHGVVYKTAWRRFKDGKIPGAYMDDTGHVYVPDPTEELHTKAVIYARVSTHGQKDDLYRQAERLREFAVSRGFEIVDVVSEVGSGVSDTRTKLTSLINRHERWGTLIVEHRDRLTRVGFGWWPVLLNALDKQIIVADESSDSDEGRVEDILSILYAYAASSYGRRGAKNRAERAAKALRE